VVYQGVLFLVNEGLYSLLYFQEVLELNACEFNEVVAQSFFEHLQTKMHELDELLSLVGLLF
jgi:hypothetical protein